MAAVNSTESVSLSSKARDAAHNSPELLDFSWRAYSLYNNTLAFVIDALDDDRVGGLPIK